MFAVHARYRGRAIRRAEFVQESAAALSSLEGVEGFENTGVEDIASIVTNPEAACDVIMALLSAQDWAICVTVLVEDGKENSPQRALSTAARALGKHARAGFVKACVKHGGKRVYESEQDIEAIFLLLAFVLGRRSEQGREATSLMRRGFTQQDAADELGVSKQAICQRLRAAGWAAEDAGYDLAINLLRRAEITGV